MQLNQSQKIIIKVFLALIVLSFLFPCWEYRRADGRVAVTTAYRIILSPPTTSGGFPMTIDYGRMVTQIAVIIVVGGGLLFLKKGEEEA